VGRGGGLSFLLRPGARRRRPHRLVRLCLALAVMSVLTYTGHVTSAFGKPLVWLRGEVKTPPFSSEARLEAGFLLRRLQQGEALGLPRSRPLPVIGPACHELRIRDRDQTWRIVYYIDRDAVVILDVFSKKTPTTPKSVVDSCRTRLATYKRLG
jgi:phage-related protein